MPHVHATSLCCTSMVQVRLKCICRMPMLHVLTTRTCLQYVCVHAARPCQWHAYDTCHALASCLWNGNLHVLAAYPWCMSLLHIHVTCPCCTPMQHVHAACSRCMFTLHDPTASLCCLCLLLVRAAYLCCMSVRHVRTACPSVSLRSENIEAKPVHPNAK
jgi:hypothetical protein